MKCKTLYEEQGHKVLMLARDPKKHEQVIDTNEFIVVSNGEALLLDPGGTEIFPAVLREISKLVSVDQIKTFFASHQDPDVMSSLPLWLGLCPTSNVYMPWLWTGFIAHFGVEFASRFVAVPDHGGNLPIGTKGKSLTLVPAHYCHSSGNFSVYDPTSRILFSGDIGAALLSPDYPMVVADFNHHIQFMEGFHKRWMPSNEAKNRWVARVRKLDVRMLAPQHGALFQGDDVGRFLDWFEALEVGHTQADLATV